MMIASGLSRVESLRVWQQISYFDTPHSAGAREGVLQRVHGILETQQT